MWVKSKYETYGNKVLCLHCMYRLQGLYGLQSAVWMVCILAWLQVMTVTYMYQVNGLNACKKDFWLV